MDTGYYPETRFVVLTPNPKFRPLLVYEVERGVFDTMEAATVLANELAEMGEPSEIQRRQWREVRHAAKWTPAKRPPHVPTGDSLRVPE
jgi:hypothetical protein